MRADAQRNREKLLKCAVRLFSERGPEVALDAVAKEAGVGIGTLYRHFPTREALIEAAYRNELAEVCEAARELLAELPADQALRAWMDRFLAYWTTKSGMSAALNAVIATGANPYEQSRDLLDSAIRLLLAPAAESGALRTDVAPEEVLFAISGVALATAAIGHRELAGRQLDLIMDGLRYRP
ncbi:MULTISPECIES: TetR/AcrR family transcriptional regulator [unclassified Crossiella]|uniref:TetR/AcrR family transcriptional regulator n=1 Tax=unclassified Crossiella TaxID=2620835 RepID=UPI001FFFFB79|nr:MULTISPECIES: TetR/AcrR family transcriptional regulator [unclassified Crossiella]MCK2237622.1 TetR/AcrR family transcriptional regulator [Crossiella sp. S99.2]MCK2254908.1 TetR/AcrR family transcriptional regulator [Crossiella sp. S99.1]